MWTVMNDGDCMMKDRIRMLRLALNMTQEEFASHIGVKRNTVSAYESGRNTPITSVVNLICNEFNVSKSWLVYGEGKMLDAQPHKSLDTLAEDNNLSVFDYLLLEKFMMLRKADRDAVVRYVQQVAEAINNLNVDFPDSEAFENADSDPEQTNSDSPLPIKTANQPSSFTTKETGIGVPIPDDSTAEDISSPTCKAYADRSYEDDTKIDAARPYQDDIKISAGRPYQDDIKVSASRPYQDDIKINAGYPNQDDIKIGDGQPYQDDIKVSADRPYQDDIKIGIGRPLNTDRMRSDADADAAVPTNMTYIGDYDSHLPQTAADGSNSSAFDSDSSDYSISLPAPHMDDYPCDTEHGGGRTSSKLPCDEGNKASTDDHKL